MKKYPPLLFLIVFLVPSVTFASWWNPFSWQIFKKKQVTPQVQVINTEKERASEEKIIELQKQVDTLKSLEKKTNVPEKNTNSITQKQINLSENIISLHTAYIHNIEGNIKTLESRKEELQEYLDLWKKLKSLQEIMNLTTGITEIDNLNKNLLDLENSQILIGTEEIQSFSKAIDALSAMKNQSLLTDIPKLQKSISNDKDLQESILTINTYNSSIKKLMEVFSQKYVSSIEKQRSNLTLASNAMKAIIANIERNTNLSINTNDTDNLIQQLPFSRPIICTSSSAFGVTYTTCN